MQSLSENKLLCYGLCASYALVFLAATEQLPWLNETMQLVPMPTASVTRWGWRRACAILELTLAFHVRPSFLPSSAPVVSHGFDGSGHCSRCCLGVLCAHSRSVVLQPAPKLSHGVVKVLNCQQPQGMNHQ